MNIKELFQKLIRYVLLLVLIGLVAFYMYVNADPTFQNDSEGLVVGKMLAEQLNLDIDDQGYGLGR